MWIVVLVVAIGLGVALAPGPMLALVSANTMRGGLRSGALSAVAAATADALITVMALVIVDALGSRLGGVIGMVGGLVLVGLAVDAFVVSRRTDPVPRGAATHRKFVQAAQLELSMPQALLFGLTVAGPVLTHLRDVRDSWPWALAAVLSGVLLGTRLVVAAWVARSGSPLPRRSYRLICRCVAVVLSTTGVVMIIWLGGYGLHL
ncbi:MAG: LysE family transporter [Nocardioidaceae bacterium]